MANTTPPTLIDPKGMGGVIAQDGFDYQVAIGLIKLPAWLTNPAFEQLIFEGLEDVEARFFNPYAPAYHVLERIQAKSGALNKSGVKSVFSNFLNFDQHHPKTASIQTLVTPQLPADLVWIARDPKRVRNARPFYAPFGDVTHASDAALSASFQDEFGLELGNFVCSSAEVTFEAVTTNAQAAARFAAELCEAFPEVDQLSSGVQKQAFHSLVTLAGQMRGRPMDRNMLVREIEAVLGRPILSRPDFPLHIRSSRQEPNNSAMEIDASAFSGPPGNFPPTVIWDKDLIGPLQTTASWLQKNGIREVSLSGGYRTSTSIVIGKSLRAATGFELSIPTKSGVWRTDSHGHETAVNLVVNEASMLVNTELNVAFGILQDPATILFQGGLQPEQVLRLHSSDPVVSAEAAQALVAQVKRIVTAAVIKLQPLGINLYFAGPAALAIALGHRWNVMPKTQLHEFDAQNRTYQRTAILI